MRNRPGRRLSRAKTEDEAYAVRWLSRGGRRSRPRPARHRPPPHQPHRRRLHRRRLHRRRLHRRRVSRRTPEPCQPHRRRVSRRTPDPRRPRRRRLSRRLPQPGQARLHRMRRRPLQPRRLCLPRRPSRRHRISRSLHFLTRRLPELLVSPRFCPTLSCRRQRNRLPAPHPSRRDPNPIGPSPASLVPKHQPRPHHPGCGQPGRHLTPKLELEPLGPVLRLRTPSVRRRARPLRDGRAMSPTPSHRRRSPQWRRRSSGTGWG